MFKSINDKVNKTVSAYFHVDAKHLKTIRHPYDEPGLVTIFVLFVSAAAVPRLILQPAF